MHRYLLAIAVLCLVQTASAQVPDTVFLERMTWPEVRDALGSGTAQVVDARSAGITEPLKPRTPATAT